MTCLLEIGLEGDARFEGEPHHPRDIANYRIELREDGSPWELGRGAMGVTYRALDTALHRAVALKIVAPDRRGRVAAARERFSREARLAAGLRHPNIATVYHFGLQEETNELFYAMELVEGETLDERVRRTGPMDARTTIAIAQQVVEALAAAEKNGLIHRDLKPANIMLVGNDGAAPTVKIIDFGLAKALTTQTEPGSATQNGFVGTPAFASPEQFAHAPLDVRSDVYSLGVTLWFALTGKTPFGGGEVSDIRDAQRLGSLPVEQLRAARVPSSLRTLVESMLAHEPARRPGTQDLAERVRKCGHAISRPTWRRQVVWISAVTIVVCAVLSYRAWQPTESLPRASGTSNPAAQLAYEKGVYFWNKRETDWYREAEKNFRRAIELDPAYAKAHAGLGNALQLLAAAELPNRQNNYAMAEAAIRRALELEPNLPEAHAGLGLIAMNYYWDWGTAESEFKRAIELDPFNALAHHWYAELLTALGRVDESLREVRRARDLDPLALSIAFDVGKYLLFARRFAEAESEFKEALKLNAYYGDTHFTLALALAYQGKFGEATERQQEQYRRDPNFWNAGILAYLSGLGGDKAGAARMLSECRRLLTQRNDHICLVYCYLGAGDKERAMEALETDYLNRAPTMISLRVAPLYDPLRSDPRFTDLLRRVHLAR